MSKIKKTEQSSEDFSSTSCSSSSLSSDEEIDARDLKPIKEYLSNRRELARQLFKSVKTEKIRMMLPQVLKKMDLNEIEEWCTSELSGMSKTRILCILNGKTMLESSDTSESDNSGPSLEIISDTEEWLTEDDNIKKEEGGSGKTRFKKDKSKVNAKPLSRKDDLSKTKVKSKGLRKDGNSDKFKNITIKKEGENEQGKEKEGDSLLDLLELEMRARAIRALIRKEDDIIPSSVESKVSSNNTNKKENHLDKASQDELKAKENCRRQLEKIIGSKQVKGDEEDVVLIVQPTPTIELLSSESESEEHGARVNQKLENERVLEAERKIEHLRGDRKTLEKSNVTSMTDKAKVNAEGKESSEIINRASNLRGKASSSLTTITGSDNENKRIKLRRKSHSKEYTKIEEISKENSHSIDKSDEDKIEIEAAANVTSIAPATNMSEKIDETVECVSTLKQDEKNKILQTLTKKVITDDDKLVDMEEIIDLDNYSDDMDDIDSSNNDKNKKKHNTAEDQKSQQQCQFEADINVQKLKSTETWATRYYQTDDVQNVIKESKIQSEIRKRLRERQRLSKLGNSPSLNPAVPCMTEVNNEKFEQKPTGSVEEYLALKQSTSLNPSTSNSNSDIPVVAISDKSANVVPCINANTMNAVTEQLIIVSNDVNVDKTNNTDNTTDSTIILSVTKSLEDSENKQDEAQKNTENNV